MSMRGKFVTIEGQDGAGKSTNIAVMQTVLDEQKIDYVISREPGGTEFGEQIRSILLSSGDDSICDMSELLLIFAARAQHIADVIEPALASEKWVLCDRFTDATYAYQGGGRGLDIASIRQLEKLVQKSLQPDFTLLLDLPVAVGESRAGQRSAPDRFEQQKIQFKQKVREFYLQLAEKHQNRITVIDAGQSLQQVEKDIRVVFEEFIGAHD